MTTKRGSYDARVGAFRAAARRLGITTAEYVTHLANGERWCWMSRHWVPLENFGRGSYCKACQPLRRERKRKKRNAKRSERD